MGPGFEVLLAGVLLEGMEQKRAETASGLLRTFHQAAIQHNLMEKILGQILGLFVGMALTSEKAVDGLPVLFQQMANTQEMKRGRRPSIER